MCATCPVLRACRDYGVNAQEPYGIWGGLTAQERERRYGHRSVEITSGPGVTDNPPGPVPVKTDR